jgi:hypothetical protein
VSDVLPSEPSDPDISDATDGSLRIYVQQDHIVVSSTLRHPTPVRIYSASGSHVTTFTIQPEETIETTVSAKGVYIVNQKKILVR